MLKNGGGRNENREEEEDDEFEAYMIKNESHLKIEQQKRLGAEVAQLNIDIERYTRMIALVAPTTISHKAA